MTAIGEDREGMEAEGEGQKEEDRGKERGSGWRTERGGERQRGQGMSSWSLLNVSVCR